MKLRLILLLALLGGPCFYAGAQDAPPAGPEVVLCEISGMIDEGLAVVVERAVARAAKAEALVFVVDTPGGRVDSAFRITQAILSAPCKTVAYVKGMGAISAGAIISYACDEIIMAPEANFGASTPVSLGAEQSEAMNSKSMSVVMGKYRALAETNGHSALLGEAMVDPAIELHGKRNADGTYTITREDGGRAAKSAEQEPDQLSKLFENLEQDLPVPLEGVEETVRGLVEPRLHKEDAPPAVLEDGTEIISRAGELLTLTAQEAQRYGLSKATVANVDEALAHLNLVDAARQWIEIKWSEALFRWLTSPLISGLLLMLGLAGVYTEIKAPGFGLPGILGAVCLALFFGSYLVIGLADWIDVVLVVAGVILVLVEVFLLPGTSLAGVAGVFCILTGLYLALTRVPVPQYSWDYLVLRDAGVTMTVASATFLLFVLAFWKIFPRTPMYGWIVLQHEQHPEFGYTVQTGTEARAAVGLHGVAVSVLRPAGRGRFSGTIFDVVTRGEFVDAGMPIRIIQAEGNRYVVVAEPEQKT